MSLDWRDAEYADKPKALTVQKRMLYRSDAAAGFFLAQTILSDILPVTIVSGRYT